MLFHRSYHLTLPVNVIHHEVRVCITPTHLRLKAPAQHWQVNMLLFLMASRSGYEPLCSISIYANSYPGLGAMPVIMHTIGQSRLLNNIKDWLKAG